MDPLQQMFASLGGAGGGAGPGVDVPVVDSAETIQISSLSLLKMLKHGEYRRRSSRTGAAGELGASAVEPCARSVVLLHRRFPVASSCNIPSW